MPLIATAEGVAAITAGATLLGATGLAYVTINTTNKRLREERLRQKRELDAEAERQASALKHDRELADVADLRQVLDEGAAALDKGAKAQSACSALIDLPPGIADMPNFAEMVREAENEMKASAAPVLALGARLRVRLGSADQITEAFGAARVALGATESMIVALRVKVTKPGDDSANIERATSEYREAVRCFTAAAVQKAGTVASVVNRDQLVTGDRNPEPV